MGMLFKGKLINNWLEKEIDKGEFKRMESTFRHWVTSGQGWTFSQQGEYIDHLHGCNSP